MIGAGVNHRAPFMLSLIVWHGLILAGCDPGFGGYLNRLSFHYRGFRWPTVVLVIYCHRNGDEKHQGLCEVAAELMENAFRSGIKLRNLMRREQKRLTPRPSLRSIHSAGEGIQG